MDFLKLLPILFIAAQGEARTIHQQLLPAIPGYVPVYIQQGPDVQVIYESGRKVAVHDPEIRAKPVDEKTEEEVPNHALIEESQQTDKEQPKEKEEHPVASQSAEQPQGPVKSSEDTEPGTEDKKPGGSELQKQEGDEQSNAVEGSSSHKRPKDSGSGSAVLVPGYQTSEA